MKEPKVRADGSLLWISDHNDTNYPGEHCVDLNIGEIETFRQHGRIVYAKNRDNGVVVTDVGDMERMKVHHEVPEEIKTEFTQFMQK